MSMVERDGNERELHAQDYTPSGDLKSTDAELALVVGATRKAEQFVSGKQWTLLWRDADLLYQSPRPMSTYENTYVLEPNVQRFTVAKVCNAVTPQLYKGLFYADPPFLLRPRPGTTQQVIDAKAAIFSYLLDECKFKTETKWGLEQMAHLGTCIYKWGVKYQKVVTFKRTASVISTNIEAGDTKDTQMVPTDEPPKVERIEKVVPRPFFESRPLDRVLVDPKCAVGDIRRADFVIDVRYMDFYELKDLQQAISELSEDDPERAGWNLPETEGDLQKWWLPPTDANNPEMLMTDQTAHIDGVVHHAERVNVQVTPDLLMKKLEVLEYWDKGRKIIVLDRRKVLFAGDNQFNVVPFLSANWWNRPKSFYGMGLGLIVGQNQRVDQGTINAILKILSFGVNPIYLRKQDSNSPTQMIRTGLGKILTVSSEVDKAFKLLDTPKVPSDIWAALQESEKSTESTSGADQMLVQGSTAGPRSSMGRTAGGASILSSASATRLDGPLDNFIEQVFKPFLYVLDMLVLKYLPDKEIFDILGEEMGKDFVVDFQKLHDARLEFEVMAGASLSAKRTMAQSLTLITQIFNNPQIQENLAEINGEYIDFKPILSMWMESSEWKNKNDIIKPLTPEMKQRMQAKSQASQQASKMNQQVQLNEQKFQQKQQLEDQANEGRIKRDIIREAFRDNGMSEATEGVPSTSGLLGQEDTTLGPGL
jgi:hypothetical protein